MQIVRCRETHGLEITVKRGQGEVGNLFLAAEQIGWWLFSIGYIVNMYYNIYLFICCLTGLVT